MTPSFFSYEVVPGHHLFELLNQMYLLSIFVRQFFLQLLSTVNYSLKLVHQVFQTFRFHFLVQDYHFSIEQINEIHPVDLD